jgi:hypothetical protein
LIGGCITLNYNDNPASVTEPNPNAGLAEVVLVQNVEILPLLPGQKFTVPTNVTGVSRWYLMSDYALMKVNKIQIDNSRLKPIE